MKRLLLLSFLLIVSCAQVEQPVSDNHSAHVGCMPDEVVNGSCVVAEAGQRNVDLFDSIDRTSVLTENVSYFGAARGFLARPKAEGVYPGIVMIHEWWGLNENVEDMAVLLAQEGYVVLAVDLYEGEVANSSEEARVLTGSVKQPRADENMKAAVAHLQGLSSVNKDRIGSIGWCFGGAQSLQLALSGQRLQATVIYYGRVTDDKEQLKSISWPVLGIFGEKDQGIPPASVNAFKAALDGLNISNEVTIYPGADHAFANPSGARYAPEATKDAWAKTVAFFERSLKQA